MDRLDRRKNGPVVYALPKEGGRVLDPRGLEIVRRLAAELEQESIRYCHWKSTEALGRSLRGDNDLDLLVDRRDRFRFRLLLDRLGFKPAWARRDRITPAISNFYGLDVATGRLVHVHAHYRLTVGFDPIKNYALPLERPFLDLAVDGAGLKVPPVELEFIVFVLRMVLKRRLLAFLTDPRLWWPTFLGSGRPGLSGSERREWTYLRAGADEVPLRPHRYLPGLSSSLLFRCATSLSSTAPRFAWLGAGRALVVALRPYRRRGALYSLALALARRGGSFLRARLPLPARRRRLAAGGRVVALIGGDGSGKTTNARVLQAWLSKALDVQIMHLGKPPRSLSRIVVVALGRVSRLFRGGGHEAETGLLKALGHLLKARDRWRAARRARALAAKGTIVVCDRFPVRGLRFAENPQIRGMAGASRLIAALGRLEEGYYARIPEADELIVLRIAPDAAIARQSEDAAEYIRPRLEEIWSADWSRLGAHVVDAGQPFETVQAEVRNAVWRGLPSWCPLLEVAGPAGAGKSALASELIARGICESGEPGPWREVLGMVRGLPSVLLLALAGLPAIALRRVLVFEAVMSALESRVGQRGGATLLDQGPVYRLAKIVRHGDGRLRKRRVRAWLRRGIDRAADLLDVVIWLDADDATLATRINERPTGHEIKDQDERVTQRFFAEFRACFDAVLQDPSGGDGFSVERLTTDRAPAVLAREIGRRIRPETA